MPLYGDAALMQFWQRNAFGREQCVVYKECHEGNNRIDFGLEGLPLTFQQLRPLQQAKN